MLRTSSAAASHPGLRREENEDACCVRQDLGLYLVADGMGGHAAGEIASRVAVEAIEAFIAETCAVGADGPWPMTYDPARPLAANRLQMAFRLANRQLRSAIAGNAALRGMATTATGLLVGETQAVVANVGDSRIYRWHAGALQQITQDHSWVGEQVRAGVLTESAARHHPWRNVVTRALTGGEDPEIEISDIQPEAGDRMLLCSDGLSGVIAEDALREIVGRATDLATQCQALVDAANAAGGPDNITVVLLQFDVA
jgi:protein phosphatase